jgi:hypothetical protein
VALAVSSSSGFVFSSLICTNYKATDYLTVKFVLVGVGMDSPGFGYTACLSSYKHGKNSLLEPGYALIVRQLVTVNYFIFMAHGVQNLKMIKNFASCKRRNIS